MHSLVRCIKIICIAQFLIFILQKYRPQIQWKGRGKVLRGNCVLTVLMHALKILALLIPWFAMY